MLERMGVKSIATNGNKSEKKKKEASSRIELQTSKEYVNARANGSTSSADRLEERKDRKKTKKTKQSVDTVNEPIVGKEGMKGSEDTVGEKNGNDNSRDLVGSENDSVGDGGKKKKKKKKLKSKVWSDEVEVEANSDEDGDKSKKKKENKSGNVFDKEAEKSSKKKKGRKREDIPNVVDDKDKNDEEAREEGNPKLKKKSKRVSFSDNVEVFDVGPSKKKAKSLKNDDDDDEGTSLVQGKRFTPEEDEIVQNAVLKYIQENNLGENGPEMVLN